MANNRFAREMSSKSHIKKKTSVSIFQRSTEGEMHMDVTRKVLLLGQNKIVFSRNALLTPKVEIFICVFQYVLYRKRDKQNLYNSFLLAIIQFRVELCT